jgi:hypothetical protein
MALFSFRQKGTNGGKPVLELLKSLHENTRETDIKGWVDRDIIGLLLLDTDEKGLQLCVKKIANGNGNLPYSVVKATYPDHVFESILGGEDRSRDLLCLDIDDF